MSEINTISKESLENGSLVEILRNDSTEEWRQAADIEASVFIDCGYVKSAEELALEYEKYLPTTAFAIARKANKPGGSMRIIHYREDIGFKTIDDITNGKLHVSSEGARILDELDFSRTFEVGTLAVGKDLRGSPDDDSRLAVALYGAVYAESVLSDCPYVLASFDKDYFDRFKDIFGPAVVPLGEATDYMGSLTVPSLMHIPTLHEYLGETVPEVQAQIDRVESLLNSPKP